MFIALNTHKHRAPKERNVFSGAGAINLLLLRSKDTNVQSEGLSV